VVSKLSYFPHFSLVGSSTDAQRCHFCSSGTLAFHRLVPFDNPDFAVGANGYGLVCLGHRARALVIEAAEILAQIAEEIGSPLEDGWVDEDGGAETTLRLATDALAHCRGPLDRIAADAHHTIERRRSPRVRSRIARILDGGDVPPPMAVDEVDETPGTTGATSSPSGTDELFLGVHDFQPLPPPALSTPPLRAPRPVSGAPSFASQHHALSATGGAGTAGYCSADPAPVSSHVVSRSGIVGADHSWPSPFAVPSIPVGYEADQRGIKPSSVSPGSDGRSEDYYCRRPTETHARPPLYPRPGQTTAHLIRDTHPHYPLSPPPAVRDDRLIYQRYGQPPGTCF
jgi:hypothetical protein